MMKIRIQGHSVGSIRPVWPARPAAASQAPTSCRRAHSRSAADPSDPALRPSPIGGFDHSEFTCVAKAERVRTDKGQWLVLTRSSVAGFNPIRDTSKSGWRASSAAPEQSDHCLTGTLGTQIPIRIGPLGRVR
jgi:hypothetical protein